VLPRFLVDEALEQDVGRDRHPMEPPEQHDFSIQVIDLDRPSSKKALPGRATAAVAPDDLGGV
jgi:hypothetical protein